MAVSNLQEVIALISKSLFQAEKRRLAGVIVDLDKQNNEIKHTGQQGFLFNGALYRPHNASTIKVGPGIPTLDFSLNKQMNDYLKDAKEIELDEKQIQQILFKLIYKAETLQHLRDTLPECLVALVPDLSGMVRNCPEAFLLEGDERGMAQFKKLKPKIEFYSATRLLY
jgi:hypothetical protein